MKSIVVGAGIGGLATAIRLRASGHHVCVFDANSAAGGKIHSLQIGDFRFDGGPSLFTMPHFIEELFELSGKDIHHYFEYEKAPEACRYFWEDGTALTAPSDPIEFAEQVQNTLGFPREEMIEYFDHVRNIYDHSGKIFLEKPLNRASTWLHPETLRALLKIRSYDLNKTMHDANRLRLGEPHLVQLFDRFATYNGSDPYRAPGILNVIPWLEHGFGTYFPKGGMISIASSLFRLAQDTGVEFRMSTWIDEIVLNGNKAIGVRVGDVFYKADKVVCNMDIHFAYQKLLPNAKKPNRILKQERSSSALVFYWGIKEQFDELGLHNIMFSDSYKEEFQALFEHDQPIDDPTVYIHVSSKMEPSDAPEGCENWFVMVNAPHHKQQDWINVKTHVKRFIIEKINRLLKQDIEALIVCEKIWTPEQIEKDTWSFKGALYGNSSNNKFAAFLRHPNASTEIDDLYFCGGSVHPGGGIPLALLSGKITSELIVSS